MLKESIAATNISIFRKGFYGPMPQLSETDRKSVV